LLPNFLETPEVRRQGVKVFPANFGSALSHSSLATTAFWNSSQAWTERHLPTQMFFRDRESEWETEKERESSSLLHTWFAAAAGQCDQKCVGGKRPERSKGPSGKKFLLRRIFKIFRRFGKNVPKFCRYTDRPGVFPYGENASSLVTLLTFADEFVTNSTHNRLPAIPTRVTFPHPPLPWSQLLPENVVRSAFSRKTTTTV
jgi:hypothetical protein